MQVYMVGGAVRDALLGLPVQDHDWVVVGSHARKQLLRAGLPARGQGLSGLFPPQDARGIRAGAHRAQDGARLPRL
jgi:hypothetical protein